MLMATSAKRWTLAEMHALPADGNKYELVKGELFVTPAPTYGHEAVIARLARILDPYVERNDLGFVFRGQAVVRHDGSEAAPDLFVNQMHPRGFRGSWDDAPVPILVVEVFSPSTRGRDEVEKRALYSDVGVAEYWMIDSSDQSVRVVSVDHADLIVRGSMTWTPAGVASPLVFELERLFK